MFVYIFTVLKMFICPLLIKIFGSNNMYVKAFSLSNSDTLAQRFIFTYREYVSLFYANNYSYTPLNES